MSNCTVDKDKGTYWVDASHFPSELNAAAIVDLGGGKRGQYFAEKFLKESASTLRNSVQQMLVLNARAMTSVNNKK